MDDLTSYTETAKSQRKRNIQESIIGILYGIIEILLAFRLGFKLLGASPENEFVRGIYTITQYIVGIFEDMFSRTTTSGSGTTAIFEPATLISMLIVALIVWGLMKVIKPRVSNRYARNEYTGNSYHEK